MHGTRQTFNRPTALVLGLAATGVCAGCAGIALSWLLHGVQHLAFGYGFDSLTASASFLQGVEQAAPRRRVFALALCGLVAGFGWFFLFRAGRTLVSIPSAASVPPRPMPAVATVAHALLQIITVGLGSPLGRESAPRELGALCAGRIGNRLGLGDEDTALLVACGSGAGLAAVYNVPLAGALFALETLLVSLPGRRAPAVLFVCVLGSLTAWAGLGDARTYIVPPINPSASLLLWAVFAGPLLGAAAWLFARATARARKSAVSGPGRIPACLANFFLIGLLAVPFPELLGNGKGPLQLSLVSSLTPALAAALLVLRFAVTVSTCKAGAFGGLITPSLLQGALAGILLGGCWSLFFPPILESHLALTGSAAFLAAAMSMPLTAVVLIYELTHANHDAFYPVILATAGAFAAARLLDRVCGKPGGA
ncbi:Cl-channel voltage-gated family protein [uncultured delta proteobacterium]|uniref:Cl-channel voltage-gated family protein n=1 Tax=uncultured delta proteobacterium TaxID=34034 RepID=A0A212K6N4_9DELT|nr:Cl-channel voltage-gated family protein [uncultured delta proteobacterium]